MKKILFISLLSAFISCNNTNESVFILEGKSNNIPNETWLYLKDTGNDVILDSVRVTENIFQFKTKIDSLPIRVIIHDKSYKNYNFLWLDEYHMTLDASNSNFKDAVISGDLNKLSHQLANSLKEKSRKERLKIEQKFVENNPSSIISASILSTYKTTFNKANVRQLYHNFSQKNKTSIYGKSVAQFLELNKGEINIGDSYVDFEMRDVNGNLLQFSKFKNKYILLEFWASNCGPCRIENSNLIKTYNTFKPRGFEIFAVSEDIKKENWLKAIKKDKLPWIHVSDLSKNNRASMIYGISGIPDNFLIDNKGIIVARNLRGEKLNKKLSELFTIN
mgnify:CR=1 FL=1|tara:strand:- start:769 stop:1770 length:1002 start_codon:yes stop_codon:yes gene_type:complete